MATVKPAGRRFKLALRFRLRTLLLVLSAIAVPCGWEADRLHRRARAVALLERWDLVPLGPFRDMGRWAWWSWIPGSFKPWIEPLVAPWAYEYLYIGCGWWAGRSSDARSPSRDEQQEILSAIAVLQEAAFVSTEFPLGDDELRILSTLKNMEVLVFTQRGLSDKGVAYLQNARRLRGLVIHFPERDSAAMAALLGLKGHPMLYRLYVDGVLDPQGQTRLEAAFRDMMFEDR